VKFALLIRGAGGGAATALGFARQALQDGHQIVQVFFQGDGVHLANRLSAPPADEPNPTASWSGFAAETGVALALCSTAGLRRGVREANLAPGFHIAGLGQWLDAALGADRIVQFGG
jgi:tRNA 2-thiouridine synthesizing protein D